MQSIKVTNLDSQNFSALTPNLTVKNAHLAIELYTKVLKASQKLKILYPDNTIAHCELIVAGQTIVLTEEKEDWGFKSPKAYGGSPVSFSLQYVDVDEVFQKALDNGFEKISELKDDHSTGYRSGKAQDPFGYSWIFMNKFEDLSELEIQKRVNAQIL